MEIPLAELSFHIELRASPAGDYRSVPVRFEIPPDERTVLAFLLPPSDLHEPFAISFEETSANLVHLPRMFLEPDGAWVWVGEDGGQRWQLDGQLYDREGHLIMVEIKGNCGEFAWEQLLGSLGWPGQPVVVRLVQVGVVLEEPEFRRHWIC